ncbi:MAG: hypothetical protein RI907_858 [Pseudomonadota bacterium]|jgi:type IV pilus assembly protein PilW
MPQRPHPTPHTPAGQAGFTLVELMVGMTLALLSTVIIAAVMQKAEGNRRSTTEGSDAQINAALSLFSLQRDIQMSGYGLINNAATLGCTVQAQFNGHAARPMTLAPVIITAGANATTSDQVVVIRSGTTGYAVPMLTTTDHANTDAAFVVQSSLGVRTGDLMLALPAAPSSTQWCTLFTVQGTGGSVLTSTTIPHVPQANTWNPATTNMPSTYETGTTLAKATDLVSRTFFVQDGNLQSTDLVVANDTTTTSTVGNNVVLMKAFYGKDTDADGTVDTYDTTTPTTAAGWRQVRTVRIAVVARSQQREKEEVTQADPVLEVGSTASVTGSSECGEQTCFKLQVSPATGADTEWKHYRYKAFDTVVPLRNVLWSS